MTDVVPSPDDLSDDTRSTEAPEPTKLVERILELVASEAEALLATSAADGRLADLNVRAALATWDALHHPEEALRLLELADGHPLVPRLRLAAALAAGDEEALEAAEVALASSPVLAFEVAEAWLWRHGRIDRATHIVDRLLAAERAPPAALRVHVIELAALAHAAAGNWPRVIELRTVRGEAADPEEIAATAALVLDRIGDAAGALAACWTKLAVFPGVAPGSGPGPHALGWLRVFDIAIDAATVLDDERRFELLGKRAELIDALPGGAIEAVATRHAVASELERDGQLLEAAGLWTRVADDVSSQSPGTGRRVALLRAAWAGIGGYRAEEPAENRAAKIDGRALALAARRKLADSECAEVAASHAWRALELAAALGDPAVGDLARAVADAAGSLPGERWLDQHELASPGAAMINRLELRGGLPLRWAAAIAERAGARVKAKQLYARAAAYPELPTIRDHLLRLQRTSTDPTRETALRSPAVADPDELAESYGAAAVAELDPRCQATLWCARGVVELAHGGFADAEEWLRRAASEAPADVFSRLALAVLYRMTGRAEPLAQVLAELATTLESADARASVAREHAELLAELGAASNPAHGAGGKLERALECVRAELAADTGTLARRTQLQTELAQLLTELDREPEAVVAAYLDVLSIEPDQTAALAGIEAPARALGLWDELARAFRGAPNSPRNLEVLGEALAKIAEWSELVEVRRRQLEAATVPAEQAQRAADLAGLYERELGDVDAAIRMLRIAQAALGDGARAQELLRLLRGAQRWAEVAVVLERELPQVTAGLDPERQIAILLELAELRATRLGQPADAIQAYEAVLAVRPEHAAASTALEALYDQLGRDRELAQLLERRAAAASEPVVRGQLFARVATVRAKRGDIDGALAAYTASFAADPTNREVFTAMELVCYQAERWADAMQLYQTAIDQVEGGQSRTYRLGDLYSRRGNVQLTYLGQPDAAIASYQKVIEVDSAPAAAIQVLEELCATRNHWQPLIAAYEKRAETQRDPQRRSDALAAANEVVQKHVKDARQSMHLGRKLLAVDPTNSKVQETVERYFEDAQDPSGLVDVLKMKLQHAADVDESVKILKRIARASEEGARDVVTATEHYQKILELRDTDRDALEALGRIYESTEQWAEFIDVTRKQIKVTTDRTTRALLYFRCGSVLEAKFSREHDAIRYYHEAIKTSSQCMPAVHGLRDLYRRREEWPRVIETLELEVKLWDEDKERAGVFAQIGGIYEQQLGDIERAMTFYDSALMVDPECVPANQALFDHFFDKREWDKAQPIATALAQKAMRDGDPTTRSEFFRKRGVVARMTGDPRGAADSLVYALEIKPTNTTALDDLGSLAREQPDAWDFDATYRELDKLYRKREDAGPLLARVHVGRAAIIEHDGDLDHAAELYRQALELAPGDITVLSSLVEFHTDMRHWRQALTALEDFGGSHAVSPADRLTAMMRRAMIHADGELDPARAIEVLHEVIATEPAHQDAYYQLAQQCFLAARYPDARTAIDRVIELATAPGQPLEAPALARYYYYKGRILDAAGDTRSAAPQYRRAIEYDPGYAPPALVLARRAADGGDQRTAETLLIEAAHAAMAQGGPRAAVPLQRGLARILLASGDRPAAIEAYRGILAVEPEGASDRVALAEIYAVDDPQRAIGELRKVLERDIHHAPAYRMLSSFHYRVGDSERANRVLTALDLLGFSEEADRATMQRLRASRLGAPLRRSLDDDHRERYLLTSAAREPLGEVFAALAAELTGSVTQPSLGTNLQPASAVTEPRLVQLATEVAKLFEVEPEIFIGEKVPGLAAVTAFPRRMVVVDRVLLAESDAALRFLFGYAFEAIRGGYATLLQVGARQRRELALLLRSLLAADAELTGPAGELVKRASLAARQVLEAHAGARDLDPGAWSDGMLALAKRAGLVACDDFSAAIWMVARLSGEQLANNDSAVALGAVLGGPDLVRFYLSDDYQRLRDVLTAAA